MTCVVISLRCYYVAFVAGIILLGGEWLWVVFVGVGFWLVVLIRCVCGVLVWCSIVWSVWFGLW